ncbi:MAG: Abi family protein [Microbacterium sp.]
MHLYEFDRKLRTLIHDGIERVEVALRSHLSYRIDSIGPLAYRDATAFRPTFDHSAWLTTAGMRTARARRHSEPIRHHEEKRNGELPIWVLTEVLDFADISKLYDGLLARDQWTITQQLGVIVDDSGGDRSQARYPHPDRAQEAQGRRRGDTLTRRSFVRSDTQTPQQRMKITITHHETSDSCTSITMTHQTADNPDRAFSLSPGSSGISLGVGSSGKQVRDGRMLLDVVARLRVGSVRPPTTAWQDGRIRSRKPGHIERG